VALLLTEPWDIDGCAVWRPVRAQTPPDTFRTFYDAVPGPLPPLYERLIGTYHFGPVDLGIFRLMPNFPPSLDGLVKALKNDPVMFRVLLSHGFIQFGRGPDVDYDAVCFDLNKRSPDGDCAIVRLDHEEILINERIHIVGALAGSFRELIHQTIGANLPG
jgi:hypothetical protein